MRLNGRNGQEHFSPPGIEIMTQSLPFDRRISGDLVILIQILKLTMAVMPVWLLRPYGNPIK